MTALTRRIPLVVVAAAFCLSQAACGTSTSTNTASFGRWLGIHATQAPTLLLIDVAESTTNRHSPCWTDYTTSVTQQGDTTITIGLTAEKGKVQVNCADGAINGPFYVSVHLKEPFDGQVLIDAADGKRHTLGARVDTDTLQYPPM